MKTQHRLLIIEGDQSCRKEIERIFNSFSPIVRNGSYHADASSLQEKSDCDFELSYSSFGLDAIEMVEVAKLAHDPFKVVFVDISYSQTRDYVDIIENIWAIDSDVQVIVCADDSDELVDLISKIGISERLLILKRPFEDIEIHQMVVALSRKWDLIQQARIKKEELEDLVSERTCRLAEMNQKLMFAIEKVKRSEQAKEFFLDNISKVVRKPLSSIVVNTNLITKEGLSSLQQKHLKAIHDNSNNIMQIISNILDMAEMESCCHKPNVQNVNIQSFVNELRVFELQAREKSLDFRIVVDSELPEYIYTDSDLLRQVVAILLDNAIKFTESGHVNLKLTIDPGQIRPYLVFKVEDTGIGIQPDQQGDIFELFTPGKGNSGLGLGLAIAKKIVAKINGDIKLLETSQKGTVFCVRIPLSEF